MQSEEVAENREAWTGARPRLRLFVFTYHGSYDVEVIDHWDCDVSTVIADADYYHTASGKLWSLAVVDHGSDGTQLTWLSGYDYRIAPRTYADHRARQAMQLRYLAAQSQNAKPVVLPDGLRVVRMFPEWTAGPLWESFTDNYPADPVRLGLSARLAADLEAWNDAWASAGIYEPLDDPEGWLAEGRRLHAEVQHAMAGIAEVVPGFLPPDEVPNDRT